MHFPLKKCSVSIFLEFIFTMSSYAVSEFCSNCSREHDAEVSIYSYTKFLDVMCIILHSFYKVHKSSDSQSIKPD